MTLIAGVSFGHRSGFADWREAVSPAFNPLEPAIDIATEDLRGVRRDSPEIAWTLRATDIAAAHRRACCRYAVTIGTRETPRAQDRLAGGDAPQQGGIASSDRAPASVPRG